MKKRSAKKLLRCDACGKSGFINLKSHRCKALAKPAKSVDFELLPPADKKRLEQCAGEIRRMHCVISEKTQRFQEEVIYDFVEWGLYFVQAKHALGHGEFGDFLKSATVADLNISERSARNYMNAARNAGLTHASTAEDIETLRRSKALHGKKPTELYRLLDSAEEEHEEEKPGPKWQLVRDTAVSLREACENAVAIRDSLNKKAFQTFCARLHRTLEDMSGSQWDIVDQREREPFKEHGDIYELGS
jgi:hypothetical protein